MKVIIVSGKFRDIRVSNLIETEMRIFYCRIHIKTQTIHNEKKSRKQRFEVNHSFRGDDNSKRSVVFIKRKKKLSMIFVLLYKQAIMYQSLY